MPGGACQPGPPRGSVTRKAAGSGETSGGAGVSGPGKPCPSRRTQQGPKHPEPPDPGHLQDGPEPAHGAGAAGARVGFPAHPCSSAASRGAGADGFSRVSRPRARRRGARVVRGESQAPRTRGPVFRVPGRRPGARLHAPPASRPLPGQLLLHRLSGGRARSTPPPLGQRPARSFPSLRAAPLSGDAENSAPATTRQRRSPLAVQNSSSASPPAHRRTYSVEKKNSKLETAVPASKEGERRASARAQRGRRRGLPRRAARRGPSPKRLTPARPGARHPPPSGWAGREGWDSRRRR